jgi:hypothetical protein
LDPAFPQQLGNVITNEVFPNSQGDFPAVHAEWPYGPLDLYDPAIGDIQFPHLANVNAFDDWTLFDDLVVPSAGNSFLTPMPPQPDPFLAQPTYPVASPGYAFRRIAPAATAQVNFVAPPHLSSGAHANPSSRINDTRISCTADGCTKTFRRAVDCRRHMRKHQDSKLKCIVDDCDKKFYRLDKLRDHARQGHGMNL